VGCELVKSNAAEVMLIDLPPGFSTTKIVHKSSGSAVEILWKRVEITLIGTVVTPMDTMVTPCAWFALKALTNLLN
jgi:hypothetical protein